MAKDAAFEKAKRKIAAALRKDATQLNLSHIGLTALPAEIGQLVNLQTLDLTANKLTTLPAELGQLVNLQTLHLAHNQLPALPAEIGQLVNLQELTLSSSQLTALPVEIGQLVNLKTLGLDFNHLSALPAEIGQLVNLQILNLFENRLTALPAEIGQLADLKALYVFRNKLTTLPDSLRKLEKLEVLLLQHNYELKIPAEVLGEITPGPRRAADPRSILDYYFRTREGARPLNEAKLILVGRGGVGKTTLITRLTTGKFSRPKKTEGIIIKEWQVPLSRKEKVQLNVWDFGGQEIMHSTHQFFLTERSLYLLVLSGREGHEDEDAEYWLKLIQSFGGDSPVIVVLNKQGEHPFDVNRGGLLQKYPNIKTFVATDCENGLGIGELRKAIKRETDRLEGLRAKFPAQLVQDQRPPRGNERELPDVREVPGDLRETRRKGNRCSGRPRRLLAHARHRSELLRRPAP